MSERADVAVVTGAGSGIGRDVARRLLGDGFAVVAAGRRIEPLEETLEGMGPERSLAFVADVTDEAAVADLFAAAVDRFGRADLLFNNAGSFGASAPVDEYSLSDWNAVVAVNLTGAFICAREAFRVMSRQTPSGGRIINNGSVSAHAPRPHAVAYTATKHGITGLTKALALEGRGRGISCGQIDVGNAATPLTGQIAAETIQADGSLKSEPTMSATDVARAVSYMASLPAEANVFSMTVMATEMPFVGRG
jgi:NAD(P)-dependent dehydrogenase (short-subunit alcohol dehydrogenase family)